MESAQPTILALDFDGVLCDGLIEYFQTAWRAYCQLWSPVDSAPPAGLAEAFYRLRPVVESGWEMPVLIHSLIQGMEERDIFTHWSTIAPQQAQAAGLTSATLGATVDRVRDQWIATDVEEWLALHRFYPGVLQRLQMVLSSSVYLVIISTKEQRFIWQLLQQQAVDLPKSQIFGKEVQQPKAKTLEKLTQHLSEGTDLTGKIWFIEDRLKTLQNIQAQPTLSHIKLYLAGWGYNTAADREIAQNDRDIQLLSLDQFALDFAEWT